MNFFFAYWEEGSVVILVVSTGRKISVVFPIFGRGGIPFIINRHVIVAFVQIACAGFYRFLNRFHISFNRRAIVLCNFEANALPGYY